MSADGDDCDWFEKDEDEMLHSLHQLRSSIAEQNNVENKSSDIGLATTLTDEFIRQKTLDTSYSSRGTRNRANFTNSLRKMLQMTPLDAFLRAYTDYPDFFVGQITAEDGQELVLLYTRVLRLFCDLELPGFNEDILRGFGSNLELLEYFNIIAIKLFSTRYFDMWSDRLDRVDEIVDDLQTLLMQSYHAGVLSTKGVDLIKHIHRLLSSDDCSAVVQRPICLQFKENIERMLDIIAPAGLDEVKEMDEIYPTLDELLSEVDLTDVTRMPYINYADYVRFQKHLLREDFMIPLRQYIRVIRKQSTVTQTLPNLILHENVQIVLNKQFRDTQRHEMLFVDLLGSRRSEDIPEKKDLAKKIKMLKTGTLLCFSTCREFDNLILATVTYTDDKLIAKGFIGIDIRRQYNIGNIYNKQLLMFEAPAFFEPYNNVYNILSTCSQLNGPMQKYVVFGETTLKNPAYLVPDVKYTYENVTFNPLQDVPSEVLPLNESQLRAYRQALTREFCLIQGPPGTGKTYLSVQIVKTLIENALTPIVLITYTNESLDKFLMKLSTHTQSIVRFGSQSRLPEVAKYNVRDELQKRSTNGNLKRLYYETDQEFKAKFEELQMLHEEFDGSDDSYQRILAAQTAVRQVDTKLQTIRVIFQYYVARETSVIAMTTTYAAKNNFLFRLLKSSIVIFEEAAEILESHIIACLTPYTQHVIMIGDHLQLKPYTTTYQHSQLSEMNVSLFERMIRQNLEHSVLNTQYRMRPAIAELICPIIYEELFNHEDVEKFPAVRKMTRDVYFVSHEHVESKPELESSVYNKYEIKELIKLASFLIEKADYLAPDIVILSPYAKQVELINLRILENDRLKSLKAATVDSFQGLEANIVLLSLVRSNVDGQIGFLRERNRICVALSRAKHGLYVIGNMQLLATHSSTWRTIKEKLEIKGEIGDEFPYEK